MELNETGKIVVDCWNRIPQHFWSVELDLCIVMPNHIHRIIILGARETQQPQSSTRSQPNRRGEVSSPALGQVIAYFKYQSTKSINQQRDMPGISIWQRNYYDHVIRDDIDLQRVRQYITHNPMQWELDQLHPNNLSK